MSDGCTINNTGSGGARTTEEKVSLFFRAELSAVMRIDFREIFYKNYILKRRQQQQQQENNSEAENDDEMPKRRLSLNSEEKSKMIRMTTRAITRLQNSFREASDLRRLVKLQRWYRCYRRLICTNNTEKKARRRRRSRWAPVLRRKTEPLLCPLTLEPIPIHDSIKLISHSGTVLAYTCSKLVEYMRSQRAFVCPLTKQEINRVEVRRIRKKALMAGAPAYDLLDVYDSRLLFMRQSIDNTNLVVGMERTCMGILDRGLRLCETTTYSYNDVLRCIETEILPEHTDLVYAFADLDHEACRMMLRTEIELIADLLKRNQDLVGLMPYIQSRVAELLEGCRVRRPMTLEEMTVVFINSEARQQRLASRPTRATPPPPPPDYPPPPQVGVNLLEMNTVSQTPPSPRDGEPTPMSGRLQSILPRPVRVHRRRRRPSLLTELQSPRLVGSASRESTLTQRPRMPGNL